MTDVHERRSAGRATGLLWLVGGISGALFYLVPGADLAHWRLGLVSCSLSVALGVACLLAPWTRMRSAWFYAAAGVSLAVIPIVVAINGGADSPTMLYLFLANVLFGYYLPTRLALAFLAVGVLVPATPMLYDPQALEATYVLTAPIYAAVGLTVVLAKRQLVAWRNEARELSQRDLSERIVSAIRDALIEDEGDVDSLLETADRRLRRAKGDGKDRWDAGSEGVGVHVRAT